MANTSKLSAQSFAVHGGQVTSQFDENAEALYLTSSYTYESAEMAEAAFNNEIEHYIYSRYDNPTVAMFEERLRGLEGAEACRATSSGMAACYAALMCDISAGDRIVASSSLFGSSLYILTELMPRIGVTVDLVPATDYAAWEQALSTPAKYVFFETPTNPTLALLDIQCIADLAHKAGAQVMIDNVFASPIGQKPLEFGVDIVIYSATKHMDGQGRCLGGAVLGPEAFVQGPLKVYLRHTGPSISPFNAWVLLKGLETLSLRVNHQSATALHLAQELEQHPALERVLYPGLRSNPDFPIRQKQMKNGGTILSLVFPGTPAVAKARAFAAINALNLIRISNNLGDAKSLITPPATTTHQRLSVEERLTAGITDGLIRVSVGLEDANDLLIDLTAACDAAV